MKKRRLFNEFDVRLFNEIKVSSFKYARNTRDWSNLNLSFKLQFRQQNNTNLTYIRGGWNSKIM